MTTLTDPATAAAWFGAWGEWAGAAIAFLALGAGIGAFVVQAKQLGQLKRQVDDEKETNLKQSEYFGLQIAELRASQSDRESRSAEQRRAQSLLISIDEGASEIKPPSVQLDPGDRVWVARVTNRSTLPIRWVSAGIRQKNTLEKPVPAVLYSRPQNVEVEFNAKAVRMLKGNQAEVLRGEDYSFYAFERTLQLNPNQEIVIRFRDNQGIWWELDNFDNLKELTNPERI